jgi:PIN domain nuclease of toxin-antitoxin system
LRILLDTHLVLWWLDNSNSLPDEARELIRDPNNTLFVSAITVWEIWLKESLGKLRLPPGFEAGLAFEAFENLPFTAVHAREVGFLPWHHRDPFDRALVAQARIEGLLLLSADAAVKPYGNFIRFVR